MHWGPEGMRPLRGCRAGSANKTRVRRACLRVRANKWKWKWMQTCVECVPQGEVFATLRELFESAPAQVEIARALGLVQYALDGYVDLVSGPSARIEHHRTGHVAIGATRAISRNQTKGIHRAHKTVHFHYFQSSMNQSSVKWPSAADRSTPTAEHDSTPPLGSTNQKRSRPRRLWKIDKSSSFAKNLKCDFFL